MRPAATAIRSRAEARPDTQERLLAAAIRLFQERGYHGAGLAELLDAADAPKGSLYHHFPGGKSELALAAIGRVRADYEAAFELRRTRPTTAAEMIRWLAHVQANWLAQTGWKQGALFTSLAASFMPDAPEIRQALARFAERRHALIAEALREDGARDAADLATLAIAALDGGMIAAKVAQRKEPLIGAADRVARLAEAQGR